MRENVIVTFFLFVVLFAVSGCTVIDKEPSDDALKKREKIQEEKLSGDLKSTAIKFKDDFFNGLSKGDYKLFSKNFIPELREKFSKKNFPKLCQLFKESKGKIINCEFMGELDRYTQRIFLWKIRFEKDLIKLKDGTKVPRDRMFYIIVGEVDGKYRIFGAIIF